MYSHNRESMDYIYIWSFQYRVLNYILYTNAKLDSVTLQKKSCITSFLNAPMRESFGKHSPLGGLNLLRKILL